MAPENGPLDCAKHVEDYLLLLDHYVSRPGFLASVGWARMDNADVLVDSTTKNIAVLIVVGKANHTKMRCGPVGSFASDNPYGTLDKAKFQFTISRPDKPVMACEYDKAYRILDLMQKNISKTNKQEHFLEEDSHDMRLGQFMFEKREIPLDSVPRFTPKGDYAIDGAVLLESLISTTPPADALESEASLSTLDDTKDSNTLDDITREYAKHIPPNLQRNYHDLMKYFAVTPFRLYTHDGAYVSPENVESVLHNGLVECHFTLKHYHFKSGEKGSSDKFTAALEQTIWLKAGKRRLVSGGYNKRKNPLDGPTQPKVNKSFKTVAGSSPSSSNATKNSLAKSSLPASVTPLPVSASAGGNDGIQESSVVSVSGDIPQSSGTSQAIIPAVTGMPPPPVPVNNASPNAVCTSSSVPEVLQAAPATMSISDIPDKVPLDEAAVQHGSVGIRSSPATNAVHGGVDESISGAEKTINKSSTSSAGEIGSRTGEGEAVAADSAMNQDRHATPVAAPKSRGGSGEKKVSEASSVALPMLTGCTALPPQYEYQFLKYVSGE
ncbi:hypothetical protein HWV62_23855 [Athelia sp. TMB]|nr:hypothetical protein HWV62_23855 [Athelia sp. TMB]